MYILGPPVNVYNFTTYLIFPFQVSMHIARPKQTLYCRDQLECLILISSLGEVVWSMFSPCYIKAL